jgi:hypothetical protein
MISTDTLRNIFNDSGSDKSSSHNYEVAYSQILPEKIDSMLEVGISNGHDGKSSLWAWSVLYPDAKIYGADNDIVKLINDNNIESYRLDQSDVLQLFEFSKLFEKKLDVIVDDGSHVFKHAFLTYQFLFHLTDLYIIEDIAKNYNGWQQTVADWKNELDGQENILYGVIDTLPEEKMDDSVVIWIKRK